MSFLGRKGLRKQQNSAFLSEDFDAPLSRVRSTAENQNKALYEQSFDFQLRNSQHQAQNVTISQYQCMNSSSPTPTSSSIMQSLWETLTLFLIILAFLRTLE